MENSLKNFPGNPVNGQIINSFEFSTANGEVQIVNCINPNIIQSKSLDSGLNNLIDLENGILNSFSDAVVILDSELMISRVNRATIDLTGFSEDELIGQSIKILSDNKLVNKNTFERLFQKTGYRKNLETSCAQKSGGFFPVSLSLSKINNSVDHKYSFVCVAQNITKRKRLEAESRVISEIIKGVSVTSNLDDLLHLIHKSIGKILYAQNCFVALYNPDTEMLNMQFFIDKYDTAPPPIKLGRGLSAYVFRQREAKLLTPEIIQELIDQGEVELGGTGPAIWLGIPLRTPTGIIGVLVVQHYEEKTAYTDEDVRLLTSVGDQIGLAIERKRHEDALRKSEERFQLITRATNDAIWDWNLATNDLWWNSGFQKLFGYSADKAGSTLDSWRGRIHPEDYERIMKVIYQVVKSGDSHWTSEYRFRRSDGTYAFVVDRGYVVYDDKEQPIRILGSMMDVSENKKLEQELLLSEDRYRAFIEQSTEGIWRFDFEQPIWTEMPVEKQIEHAGKYGFLAECNDAMAQMYGFQTADELRGKRLSELFFLEDKTNDDYFCKFISNKYRLNEAESHEINNKGEDKYFLNNLIGIIENNYLVSAWGTQRDVTERRHAARQLELFNEKLQQSNRELQDFAYVASHDLQEPLRKVQAFAARLSTKYSSALDETGLDYLERMRSAGERMQKLVQDLLTFSRVATKAQPLVEVNLDQITREVLSDLELAIEQCEAVIEIDNLPVLDADPLQMRQLMQNLIANALKFRRKNTRPVIKVYGEPVENFVNGVIKNNSELFQIVVQDNGIGFDEKYLDRIFTVFQRLHGRSEYEGSGIGLAVCRKIAERHFGHITAKSELNEGSAFIVTIPVKQKNFEVN